MAIFISLTSFTDQGIRNVQDTVKRADAVKAAAAKYGVTVKDMYWTIGNHDMVVVFEAPDDAAFTAFGLSIGKAGNVRTQTLRAFTRDEMSAILAKVA
jgi:uncharacterized protein with GYD domain